MRLTLDELDMVMNVGLLLSGCCDDVEDDIRAVVEAAEGTLVKVILEARAALPGRAVEV